MRRSGKKYTISGTAGCEILPELDVRTEDSIMMKSRFSAFHRTELDRLLETYGATCLIIAGITTAWCVRSTAVDAYQRDYHVVVAKDCTAAFTDEDHLASLQAMDGYIADVLANSEVFELIEKV
jgi:nicotinamidase-related amidase